MLKNSKAFSGFAVKDVDEAYKFYADTLGLDVSKDWMGLQLKLANMTVFVYGKEDHQPANFTILNFPVENIDQAIEELSAKGIKFERYDNLPAPQDEKGVLRGKEANQGPNIAWFQDPAGNILSILED